MGLIPTPHAIIGQFVNGRNAQDDFLQLANNHGGTVFGWIDSDGHLQGSLLSGISAGVSSINSLVGTITLAAGTNITIVPTGNTLTINSTSTPGGATTDVQINNAGAFYGDGNFTYTPGTQVVAGTIFNAATGFQIAGAATSGKVLRGNGTNFVSASLTAADVTAAGSDTDVQVNSGGAFYGDNNFTYNHTTQAVSITGTITVTGAAIAGTTPGNFISTHNGPTNVLDSVLALSNSGGGPIAYISRSSSGALSITNDGAAIPIKGFLQFSGIGDVQLLAGNNGAALAMNTVAGTFPAGSVSWSMPDTGVGTARFHLSTGSTNIAWDWDTGTGYTTMFGLTSGSAAIGVAAIAGTPNPMLLPTATGSSGQVLTTNGGNPQQLSWTSAGTGTAGTVTGTIASGTAVLGTTLIGSGAKATTVTVSAPNVLATDNVMADFSVDPTSTTGYTPSVSGMLTIIKFCTAGNVNFIVVNNTGGSITPGAVTLNWRVVR